MTVPVRERPNTSSGIVDVFRRGEEVVTTGETREGGWLRLKSAQITKMLPPLGGWMLEDGRALGLGLMLKKVEDEELRSTAAPTDLLTAFPELKL